MVQLQCKSCPPLSWCPLSSILRVQDLGKHTLLYSLPTVCISQQWGCLASLHRHDPCFHGAIWPPAMAPQQAMMQRTSMHVHTQSTALQVAWCTWACANAPWSTGQAGPGRSPPATAGAWHPGCATPPTAPAQHLLYTPCSCSAPFTARVGLALALGLLTAWRSSSGTAWRWGWRRTPRSSPCRRRQPWQRGRPAGSRP